MVRTRFPHHRLDVYRLSLELFREVEQFAASMPAGHAELKDQVRRAIGSVVRNIAEGASRHHAKDKATRFQIARAECAEAAAAIEMAGMIGLVATQDCEEMIRRADRVAAMLTGLIRRQLA